MAAQTLSERSAAMPGQSPRVAPVFAADRDVRLRLLDADRARLKVMLLAKHAKGDGAMDRHDGFHAVYHHELREVLSSLLPNLSVGNSYGDLFAEPDYDFLFTLLNRGGFKNSEMFAPLFAVWRGVPHLGASPILRGLGDDKHLTKLAVRARGVPTPDSAIYRFGSDLQGPPEFPFTRLVVKPNASSASWGIKICDSWEEAREHRDRLFTDSGQDVIMEAFFDGIELAVPVIGGASGEPVYLPVMKYGNTNDRIRTYEEKRGLVQTSESWGTYDDPQVCGELMRNVQAVMPELWPFDYGRFEFKFAPDTGEFSFIELNMSCNLWSRKTVANSWKSLGFDHSELIETILVHSLLRQGVIDTCIKGEG